MENRNDALLLVLFPDEKRDKKALADLFKRLLSTLKLVSNTEPVLVSPDVTALCVLLEGDIDAISRALDLAKGPRDRFLLACVDSPYVTVGLSTAHQWLDHRTG